MAKQALEGTRLNAFGVDPDDLTIVGYDTKDGPEHPLYDPRTKLPLEESMVLSIMVHGVLEPVLVRKDGEAVEVIAGRRRVLHAREANKRLKKQGDETLRVPCMVKKGDDGTMLGISITENEIRRDDVLSSKAEKLRRYLATGKTEKEAAIAFGVSTQTITNWSRILDLDSHVLKAIEQGKIKASAAWALADLSREEQRQELDKLLESGGGKVTGAQAAKAVKKKRNGGEEENFKPGTRLVNKILRADKKQGGVLPSDFVRGVLWVLGDVNPRTVKGLTELIHEAEGKTE